MNTKKNHFLKGQTHAQLLQTFTNKKNVSYDLQEVNATIHMDIRHISLRNPF